ncbi:MAG TPA: PBP1A family penicillin-binding protein [Pyrinomonadaceae bacterium]|nr:PBP1A family penicillin-binding protein [Pyrinomonadaceae bacterium]
MAIEVASLPNPARTLSFRRLAASLTSFLQHDPLSSQRLIIRTLCGVLAITLVIAGDSLLRSYKYYSRVVDARLANGYLTSRPGLYAAPRTLRIGQKLSRENLIVALRRAGYVKSEGSNVWSGSFQEIENGIEIRPSAIQVRSPMVVIGIDHDDRISGLQEDGIAVDDFTLEPEVLSNDLSSKGGKREAVQYTEIPPVLIHAILSTEDRRFFQHPGLDVVGIARAIVRDADDSSLGQGGSTITQQLIKNTYLSPERTLQRKYAETMLAYALERRLSKEDILALYCNEVYLGQRDAVSVRGVAEAAQLYFGKQLKDISLAEAATIAGMIQGPMRFSPTQHPEAAQSRRNVVLEAMARDGWITREQVAAVANNPVSVTAPTHSDNSLAPYFVDYVTRTSSAQFDASPTSQRIYTTIDLDLQQLAEQALQHQLEQLKVTHKNATPQVALVALDPRTGNVLAMVGGRDYAESQLNRATDARRQPGSTFKPFVYAAALEDGMSPVQMFSDAPREFVYDHNKTYRPANFGGGYSMHDVTMRTGLVKSLNVVTVDVALQTGLARIANLSEQFGLPKPERYPSLALGTKEVTPLELAGAYAAFVNGGHRVSPQGILSVGEPPARHGTEKAGQQVVSPTTAYMITNMLSAVIDHGTARSARDAIKGTAVAGKTGTSRDGWFVGYSPNLVCAVWIGFDDNEQLGLTGADAALPAWTDFMKAAVDMKPELGGRNFECPEGITFVEIDADNGALATLSCPRREMIAVSDRLAPTVECLLHGNLPETIGVGEVAEVMPETVLTQHSRPPRREPGSNVIPFPGTRIDVDSNGRRTLRNTMR